MNGYKITYRRAISHNGEFSHQIDRFETIHAKDKDEARAFAIDKCLPAEKKEIFELELEASKERILEIEWLGTVRYKVVVEYVK